jgi:polysaccharide export outer membrane protein
MINYKIGSAVMKNINIMTFLISLFVIGCSSTSGPPENINDVTSQTKTITTNSYQIGVDDKIQINVWGNEALSVEVPVRPDGMISMPLIGDVQAGERTPDQVANEIKRRLSAYIRNPNVTVILTELKSHEYISRVRVTGAVETPISLPFRQGMTVIDAILAAGGVNEFASANSTKLYRRVNGKTIVLEVKLGGILNDGELATNYDLLPGDIITVPERLF